MTNGAVYGTNGTPRGTNGNGLLPCWHCDGSADYVEDPPTFWSVECGGCGARTALSDKETAGRLWNRRVAVADSDFAMAVHDGERWGKCSECKERQGYYLDAETIRNQQERIAELERERDEWQLKCCEEAGLHASHVYQRDKLIRDLWEFISAAERAQWPELAERMRAMGIEVD